MQKQYACTVGFLANVQLDIYCRPAALEATTLDIELSSRCPCAALKLLCHQKNKTVKNLT